MYLNYYQSYLVLMIFLTKIVFLLFYFTTTFIKMFFALVVQISDVKIAYFGIFKRQHKHLPFEE